ncbi:MAG: hypothetical protein ACMVY4_07385 [Minwuia sp.]|uniref:hypothetical protein n=1 Tax=Minwuia sp. TaxID=2493630 RepID=UPI003A86ED5F
MEARIDQENRLVDFVERLERHADGRTALHMHYSRLKPANRTERQLRMAAATFTAAIKRFDAYLFELDNGDQVLISKGASYADLEPEIEKLKHLFASGDPVMQDEGRLISFYDLSADYAEFLSIARRLKEIALQKRQIELRRAAESPQPQRKKSLVPLRPENLGRLVEQLASMDISSLLRRQPVCALTADNEARPVFNELFVSIADLRKQVMPTVDLAASAPLFSYLTQYLDQRILRAMPDIEASIPLSTSININVETVMSPQFLEFDQKLRAVTRKTVVLEFQPADLFADFSGFAFARDFVRDRGYRVCLDGVTNLTAPLIEKKMLKLDLQKLVWTPDTWDSKGPQHEHLVKAVQHIGPTRIVLCRCDDHRAVDYGRSLGINLYQGRHIDALLTAQARNARVA